MPQRAPARSPAMPRRAPARSGGGRAQACAARERSFARWLLLDNEREERELFGGWLLPRPCSLPSGMVGLLVFSGATAGHDSELRECCCRCCRRSLRRLAIIIIVVRDSLARVSSHLSLLF